MLRRRRRPRPPRRRRRRYPSSSSSGCLAVRLPKPGTTLEYMSAGGDSGGYIQELPSRYNGRSAMPVVVDLHGYGVSAADMVADHQVGHLRQPRRLHHDHPAGGPPPPLLADRVQEQGRRVPARRPLPCRRRPSASTRTASSSPGTRTAPSWRRSSPASTPRQVAAIAPVSGIANPANCNPSRPVPGRRLPRDL